jgi:hypothetical protein
MRVAWLGTLMAIFAVALGTCAASADASSFLYAVNMTGDESLTEDPEACDAELGTAKSEKCSLREALEEAHKPSVSGADNIEVLLPKGTYKLSKGAVPLGTEGTCFEGVVCPVVLKGEGAGATTIESGKASGLIKTTFGAGSTVIEAVTLTSGHAEFGGAVYNEFKVPLTIREAVISANTATKAGGGIYSIGTLVVLDSRISGNSAGTTGGGVSQTSFGWTMARDSVLENHAVTAGGGLDVSHAGGAIFDSTLARNEAPAASAVYSLTGGAAIHYSTLADNHGAGAAIEAPESGSIELEGTIVAGNVPSQCANVAKAKATAANIVQGEDACAFSGPAPLNVDPKLGGGLPAGLGEGLMLLEGSPAVNAGGATCAGAQGDGAVAVDQRGLARPRGGGCDLGAIEAGADASVRLTATPEPVSPGGTLTLAAIAMNTGSEAATGTTVAIAVPTGAAFGSAPPGCTLVTSPPAVVTCSIGTLLPGQSHQTLITVRPERAGALIETATVAHIEADIDSTNDTATLASAVATPAGPPGSGAASGAGRAVSSLVGRTFTVDAHGNATVKVSCGASSKGGCEDTIALYAITGSLPARTARRSALLGRARVHIAAGKAERVRIHLSGAARARLSSAHPRLRARILLSAANTVAPASTHAYAVLLRRAKRRG